MQAVFGITVLPWVQASAGMAASSSSCPQLERDQVGGHEEAWTIAGKRGTTSVCLVSADRGLH